jgi:ribosomal protein L11 methyltransferase
MVRPPYETLYIYSLSGRVCEAEEVGLGDGFLGNWVEGENSFLFFSRQAQDDVRVLLKKRADLILEDEFIFSYDQWQGGGLEPVRIEPFLIVPPWLDDEPSEGWYKIRLDPGVVFGNCLHPTTADCLRAIAWCHRLRPFSHVMDIGTGTGVLALAAALLGATSVTAVDLNPLCVKTAAANVSLNGLEGLITVKEGRAEDLAGVSADVVVANIHFDIIRALLRMEGFNKRERLVLSGLMRSQAARTADLLSDLNYRIERQWDHEMTWYTLAARRI